MQVRVYGVGVLTANIWFGSLKLLNLMRYRRDPEKTWLPGSPTWPSNPDPRFDDEAYALSTELFPSRFIRPFEDYPEVPHRHVMAIDRTGLPRPTSAGEEVSHDLVTIKIEIHPAIRAASFGTAQQSAVESASLLQVVDRKSKMERRYAGHQDRREGGGGSE